MTDGDLELQHLFSDYSACLDQGEFAKWPAFFPEDCEYRIQPRENFSDVFDVGHHIDAIHRTEQGMTFKRRVRLFDSTWIKDSVIYPT
jgi:3-phenylpropionate/cinnamic acid dioxygenase small subunit